MSKLVKNALRCMKGTVNSDLRLARNGESVKLVGFCVSDYAGSEDRKSISGYCFRMCENGPARLFRFSFTLCKVSLRFWIRRYQSEIILLLCNG